MATRVERVKAYAVRFHESLGAGLLVEEVVRGLADACRRAMEDEAVSTTPGRKKRVAFYASCAGILDEAADKIRGAQKVRP